MAKFFLIAGLALCLAAANCCLAQYQTGPAYANGYQQQRKMVPQPQSYGQQQQSMRSAYASADRAAGPQVNQEQVMSPESYESAAGPASMAGGYASRQTASSSGRTGAAGMSYAGQQQQMQQPSAAYGAQAAKQTGQKYEEPEYPPMPFAWGYDIDDGYGNSQHHKENGDERGKRTGSYGYRDAYGVYRSVYYVADENGFRATVKTNEPGTANEAPADVDWSAEEPPATVNMGNSGSAYGSGAHGAQDGANEYAGSSNSRQAGHGTTGNGSQQQYGEGSSSPSPMAGQQQYGAMRLAAGSRLQPAAGPAASQQYGDREAQYGANGMMPMGGPASGATRMAPTGALRRGDQPEVRQYAARQAAGPTMGRQALEQRNQYAGGKEAPAAGMSQLPEFGAMMMGIANKLQRQQSYAGQAGEQQTESAPYLEAPEQQQQQQQQVQMQPQAGYSSAGQPADGASTYASMRMQPMGASSAPAYAAMRAQTGEPSSRPAAQYESQAQRNSASGYGNKSSPSSGQSAQYRAANNNNAANRNMNSSAGRY